MTPILTHERAVQGAICEIISGLSALNMEPQPINEKADGKDVLKAYKPDPDGGFKFLSDVDHWVVHSMHHFNAAIAILQRLNLVEDNLEYVYNSLKDLGPAVPKQVMDVLDQMFKQFKDVELPKRWDTKSADVGGNIEH
jgi:hypothetical protein